MIATNVNEAEITSINRTISDLINTVSNKEDVAYVDEHEGGLYTGLVTNSRLSFSRWCSGRRLGYETSVRIVSCHRRNSNALIADIRMTPTRHR